AAVVTDAVLEQARDRAEAAGERLRAAEAADPSSPGWDGEYAAASADAEATAHRLAALQSLRARQGGRGGERAAAVKAAGLEGIAASLSASRDQVAAAARDHLASTVALAAAVDGHNRLLGEHRARLAELGLAVRDDLVDEGQEHPEGTTDGS